MLDMPEKSPFTGLMAILFLIYVAVRTSDMAACDMPAYGRLIAHEALHHGRQGWQE